jgi:hypothetical protein
MRPYPISTFLFWGLDKEFVKKADIKLLTFVKSNKEESELHTSFERDKYHLVLDGQQRLTSFFITLKGTYFERNKPKELYFNALSGKELNEDDTVYEFKFFSPEKKLSFIEEDDERKKTKLWINVKRIYEIPTGRAEDIRNFVDTAIKNVANELGLLRYTVPSNINNAVFDKVHDLYYHLTSSLVINYYPEERQDYDAALDIFVRTNAGGTKLTFSDLLFSKIKRHWDEARERFRDLLREINGQTFDFDGNFILKACLVVFSQSQTDVRYKIENLSDKKIEEVKQNWERISGTIKLAVNIIKDYAELTTDKLLPSYNALIPLVYFIYKNDIKGIGDHGGNMLPRSEIEKIGQWLYRILLTGVFSGQSDNMLYQTKEVLKNAGESFPIADLNKQIQSVGKSLEINKDFLDEIEYDSTDSYLLLFLLYKNQHLKLNFNPAYRGETPQQDHIFSQNELRKAGYSEKDINDVGNIRYVTASENLWKSDTPFSQWIIQVSPEDRAKHLIPSGDWKTENYKAFLEERKKLMLSNL